MGWPKGYKMSDAQRAAISRGRKGMKFTPEHREAIAAARRGTKTPEATKALLSKIQREHSSDPEWRNRVAAGTKKRMYDPDVREKHLAALSRVFASATDGNNFSGGKGRPPNKDMTYFAAILCPLGYLMDEVTVVFREGGHHYTLDFALLDAKIDIEIDGSSHRGKHDKDAERDAFLHSLGWRVIRIKV